MKIALLQMAIQEGRPKLNRQNLLKWLDEADLRGVDVLVLPELWDTGYALSDLADCADKEGETAQAFLSHLAKKYEVAVIGGSIARESQGTFFNTSYSFDQNGHLVNQYDKVHLFGLMGEDKHLAAGRLDSHFTLGGIEMSQVICYDIRFPEWLRKQMAKGSQLLVVPAQWPSSRIMQWKILLQARAIENQAYVVAVNRTGEGLLDTFNGHSLVIDPLGKVVFEADAQEGVSVVTIDLEAVESVRGQIPVFADRRLDLYQED